MSALDTVWEALKAEDKPLTHDRAREIGQEASIAAGQQPREWNAWFDSNGNALVSLLNQG